MSTTVLEALQNAQVNFETFGKMVPASPIFAIAMDQLSNAIKALENGLSPDTEMQEHMFGEVNVGSG